MFRCWIFFLFFLLIKERSFAWGSDFPHGVIQFGSLRTGTTTQFALLCAIAKLKAQNTKVECYYSDELPRALPKNKIEVIKTHNCHTLQIGSRNNFTFFVTTDAKQRSRNYPKCRLLSDPKVVQDAKQYFQEGFPYLEKQIRNEYRPLFSLQKNETEILLEYMKKWEAVRRCCGFQMSRTYRKYLVLSGLKKKPVDHMNHFCINQNTSQMEVDLRKTTFFQKFGGTNIRDLWSTTREGSSHVCILSDLLMRLGLSFDAQNSFMWFGKSSGQLIHLIEVYLRHTTAKTDKEIYSFILAAFTKLYCEPSKESRFFKRKSPLRVREVLCPDVKTKKHSVKLVNHPGRRTPITSESLRQQNLRKKTRKEFERMEHGVFRDD